MYIKGWFCDAFATVNSVRGERNPHDSAEVPMAPNSPTESMYTNDIGPDESPSDAVLSTVSAFSDTPVVELDPLYLAIDPEAMDSVLETASDGSISFSYHGFEITVTNGEVILEDEAPSSR